MKAEALRKVLDVAHKLGLNPFAMSGTALGIARGGAFIEGDRDIDLGLFAGQYPIEQRDSLMHALIDAGAEYMQGWSLALSVGRQDTLMVDGVSVDIHRVEADRTSRYHYAYIPTMRHDYDGLWTVAQYRFKRFDAVLSSVDGVPVWAPSDIDRYCEEHFGQDWRTPRSNWHWAYDAPCCEVLKRVYVRRQTVPFPEGS